MKDNRANGLLVISILMANLLGAGSVMCVNAQGIANSSTEGLWHLDEVIPNGYRKITPDATGQNPGILVQDPALVEGKFNKAMSFDGNSGVYVPIRFLVGFPPSPEPIYVPISTNLDIQKELKIEAWINVQGFKNVTYGNIVVKCTRYDASWENVTRVYGIAIKSGIPEKEHAVHTGALSGYVLTDTAGFNEVVTTESVIPLNQWVHVSFIRSLSTGLHLYVNGYEKSTETLHGVQNPSGLIVNGTEIYFGHDAQAVIDEVSISDLKPEEETLLSQIDIGQNLLTAVIIVTVVFGLAWTLRKAIQYWIVRSRP